MTGIRFGKIGQNSIHLCVDMQKIFLEPGPWFCSETKKIIGPIKEIIQQFPKNTWFSRFLTPNNPQEFSNSWRRYYEQWKVVTQERIDPDLLDIEQTLLKESIQPKIFEKYTYDTFKNPDLNNALKENAVSTLILTGVETDVCVLSTALSGVDLGYRIILCSDAMTSSDIKNHDFVIGSLAERFDQQIEIAPIDSIIKNWK